MQLKLLYREQNQKPIAGAFLPGGSPMDWFRGMDRWRIDLHTLRCWIMPEGMASDTGSGMFVVFGKALPAKALIRYPYTCMADRLFIPLQSELWPVVGGDELKSLLLWDMQVFHPVIGLVGFEAKDEVELSAFVHLKSAAGSDWSFAHPGLAEPPVLQRIGLEAVEEPEDVLDSLKDDVGSKPLEEIPGADPDETAILKYGKPVFNALEQLGLYFILMLALIGKVLLMPFSWFFTGEGLRSGYASKGLFQKMEEWVGQRLADLDKKRDSELKRLMDLFDKDTDEALQYAIPLSSAYLNRGTAPPSTKLTRRSTDFNLRNLGGGRRVDGWNLDAYNQQLRQRYEKAANDAIAAGNYKRAAYIYAHLLGNFFFGNECIAAR
ncbi:hypothetical protein [Mucilaginibacter gracilis]|uniref:hypothetical protein n=1 Tax=Mucilaginibacter gracilis TaxID=423350 RepID=UPI000EAF7AD7|nr:hypothetical protein [Mucilaginibacter gracilis]